MAVYLLHFDHPNGSVVHYLGYTSRDPELRFYEHKSGRGSKFTGGLVRRGFTPRIAHVFPNADMKFEQRVKRESRKDSRKRFGTWCPCCGNGGPVPR